VSDEKFQGFVGPKQNWFRMPADWIDVCSKISKITTMKVVEYVLKHTWGCNEPKQWKLITTYEFMFGLKLKDGTRVDRGTGLSSEGVRTGIKDAVDNGLLGEMIVGQDGASIKKFYRYLGG